MSAHERPAFVRDMLHNLEQKRTHLAVFRMWCEEKAPPECHDVLQAVIQTTAQMIDALVAALRKHGESIPETVPNPYFIAEARKQPHSNARLHFAEQFLRRSLAWYEERLSRAMETEERALWDHLFTLETRNWATVEDYINPS